MGTSLHIGQSDVVQKVPGKIRFDESLRFSERLVTTTAEKGNAREAEQRGDKGAIWHPAQAAHAAVIATYQLRIQAHLISIRLQLFKRLFLKQQQRKKKTKQTK